MKGTGTVVKVEASGVARAWPVIPLLSGLQSGAATVVRMIHLLRHDAVLVDVRSKDPHPNERTAWNTE